MLVQPELSGLVPHLKIDINDGVLQLAVVVVDFRFDFDGLVNFDGFVFEGRENHEEIGVL